MSFTSVSYGSPKVVMPEVLPKASSNDGKGYVRFILTGSRLSEIESEDNEFNFDLTQKSSIMPSGGIGFGYYVNDKVRVELTLEQLNFHFKKESSDLNHEGYAYSGKGLVKRKASGASLMFNGFVDVIDLWDVKIFTGLGFGISRLKETLKTEITVDYHPHLRRCDTYKNKVKNKFAYSLTLGASTPINPNLDIELMYSWKNLGGISHKDPDLDSKYKGHHVSIGAVFKF